MPDRQTVASAYAHAEAAHAKLDGHEKLCAERYGNIHDSLGELKKLVLGVILGVAGFALVTLVAVILRAGHLS